MVIVGGTAFDSPTLDSLPSPHAGGSWGRADETHLLWYLAVAVVLDGYVGAGVVVALVGSFLLVIAIVLVQDTLWKTALKK